MLYTLGIVLARLTGNLEELIPKESQEVVTVTMDKWMVEKTGQKRDKYIRI